MAFLVDMSVMFALCYFTVTGGEGGGVMEIVYVSRHNWAYDISTSSLHQTTTETTKREGTDVSKERQM